MILISDLYEKCIRQYSKTTWRHVRWVTERYVNRKNQNFAFRIKISNLDKKSYANNFHAGAAITALTIESEGAQKGMTCRAGINAAREDVTKMMKFMENLDGEDFSVEFKVSLFLLRGYNFLCSSFLEQKCSISYTFAYRGSRFYGKSD